MERSSQGRPTENSKSPDPDNIEINGEVFKMAPDLKGLPEIDEEDPEIKKILNEEDEAFQKRNPNLTYDEATKIIEKRLEELETSS